MPAPDAESPRLLLSAGEASGDMHGALLCRGLAALAPHWKVSGMGGRNMAAAGMDVTVDVTADAAIGTSETLGRLPGLYRAYRRLTGVLRSSPRPRALVLIDFPEFNLQLARAARRAGVPVVYFVPPQIWAWRAGRIRTIARLIRCVLAVLPFEVELYRRAGVAVEFVGHPLIDALADAPARKEARAALGISDETLVLGLLPGSRRQEIGRLLPAMLDAGERVRTVFPGARVLLALAPTIARADVERGLPAAPSLDVVEHATHAVMASADLLLVASGTATLEAALLGTPMAVCYRVSRATELAARLLLKIPWVSLPNITLGREVVPELLQERATGRVIGSTAIELLRDRGALDRQRAAFAQLQGALGGPGVGLRAARAVLQTIGALA